MVMHTAATDLAHPLVFGMVICSKHRALTNDVHVTYQA